jgi:hypothetical protein
MEIVMVCARRGLLPVSCVIAVFAVTKLLPGQALSQKQDHDVSMSIAARLDRLSSLMIDYDMTTTYAQPKTIVTGDPHSHQSLRPGGIFVEHVNFRRLGDLSAYRRVQDPQTSSDDADVSQTNHLGFDLRSTVFSSDRVEELVRSASDSHGLRGSIDNSSSLPDGDIEVALGIRAFGKTTRMTSRLPSNVQFSANGGSSAMIIARNPSIRDEWTLDPALGYAPRSYRRYLPTKQGADIEIIGEDFYNENGVFLPRVITLKRNYVQDGTISTWQTQKIVVKSYAVQSERNTPDSYQMIWPEHTHVLDHRSGVMFVIKGGEKTINDQALFDKSIARIGIRPNGVISGSDENDRSVLPSRPNTVAANTVNLQTPSRQLGVIAISVVAILLFLYKFVIHFKKENSRD